MAERATHRLNRRRAARRKAAGPAGVLLEEFDEAVRSADGEHARQSGFDEAEDGGIGADAGGEGEDGGVCRELSAGGRMGMDAGRRYRYIYVLCDSTPREFLQAFVLRLKERIVERGEARIAWVETE